MTPNQPYLLRAFNEWIVDNQLTPHIVVDATVEGVDVPTEHVKDGQIILNISPTACGDLTIQNDWVSFKARFSGISRELFIPVPAVLAIFARENGAGTVFMDEESQGDQADVTTRVDSPELLQPLVKAPSEGDKKALEEPVAQKLQSVSTDSNKDDEPGDDDPTPTPPRPKGKPSLKVIK